MVVPLSMIAFPLVRDCAGTIWIENTDELKALVLEKGDHQVFKHEYVPHYQVGKFHIYLKEGTLVLYNRYDKERKEYTITNSCKEKPENTEYSKIIQEELRQKE